MWVFGSPAFKSRNSVLALMHCVLCHFDQRRKNMLQNAPSTRPNFARNSHARR
ncbi:hypothetical protein FHT29_004678 [Rhizobium sp. SG741]|nr:hypothetical protein [Rhizobium sp. SG741]